MTRDDIIRIIDRLLKAGIKGQIQIDFCGDGQKAKLRFTNISLEDMEKLERVKQEH
ncbi:hypothetical protein KAR48_08125 [bacterium]|nr:hypothetical protein [bacterium]